MTQKMDITLKKCTTPKFRVSFPQVFSPKSFEGQEPKYSLTMLFPKNADLKELKRAAGNAIKEKWGADKAKWPKNLRMPFRDGDEKAGVKGYENCVFVSASSKQKPGVVNQNVEEIIDQNDFYAGCFARATLIAFAYDTAGNRGVSFALQNVQKLGDGERLGGRRDASSDFDAVEDQSESENPDNYEDDDLDL
jgi:hypothetical protein